MHNEPQLLTLELDRHCDPQAWKPLLQAKPQEVPSQVAKPLATPGQAVQLLPQVAVLVLE